MHLGGCLRILRHGYSAGSGDFQVELCFFFFFNKQKLSTVLQVIASVSLVKFYIMLFHFYKVLFVRFSGFERVIYTEVFTSITNVLWL